MHDLIIIIPLIFFAGFIDAVAGGGGLISVPAYFAIGLPPHLALGNNKFSSAFGTLFSTSKYLHHKMIDLPIALTSAGFALVGATLGARTILLLRPDFLYYLLLVALPVITFFSVRKKSFGTSHEFTMSRKTMYLLAALAGLIIGFWDGFFGPGTGTFMIIIFTSVFGYQLAMANANTKVVNLASNLASLTVFIINGNVRYSLGIPAAVAGIMGNCLGSHLVVKKGNKFIRPVFFFVLILLFASVAHKIISN